MFQIENVHINGISYSTSNLKTSLNLFSYVTIKIKGELFCIFKIGMKVELIYQMRNKTRNWEMINNIGSMLDLVGLMGLSFRMFLKD